MKVTIIAILLIFISGCYDSVSDNDSDNNEEQLFFEEGVWEFKVDFDLFPIDINIYKNYLLILYFNHFDSLETYYHLKNLEKPILYPPKLLVIDYYKNTIDSLFYKKIHSPDIADYNTFHDTLYGYSFEKKWQRWNGEWKKDSHFYNNKYYSFINNKIVKDPCNLIYADNKYYIFSIYYGEFGSAVLFLNKKTGLLYGYPMENPRHVVPNNDSYYVFSYDESNVGEVYSQLIKIVPDSLPTIDINAQNNWFDLRRDVYLKTEKKFIESFGSDSLTDIIVDELYQISPDYYNRNKRLAINISDWYYLASSKLPNNYVDVIFDNTVSFSKNANQTLIFGFLNEPDTVLTYQDSTFIFANIKDNQIKPLDTISIFPYRFLPIILRSDYSNDVNSIFLSNSMYLYYPYPYPYPYRKDDMNICLLINNNKIKEYKFINEKQTLSNKN